MTKRKKVQKTKQTSTSHRYIVFCLIFIVIYTAAHSVIFYLTGQEAKTLTRVVVGALFGEILLCFLIKRFKLHEEAKIVFGKKKESEDYYDDTGGME